MHFSKKKKKFKKILIMIIKDISLMLLSLHIGLEMLLKEPKVFKTNYQQQKSGLNHLQLLLEMNSNNLF